MDCGEPWAWETIEAAAEMIESIALVKEDVAYQVKVGYAEIITWKELRKLRPKQLKISALAVVPQRNRRGRMILDLSFAVRAQRTSRGRPNGEKGPGATQPKRRHPTSSV